VDERSIEKTSCAWLFKVARITTPSSDLVGKRFERYIERLDGADGRTGYDRGGSVGRFILGCGSSRDSFER
jgi:hypothetical protein